MEYNKKYKKPSLPGRVWVGLALLLVSTFAKAQGLGDWFNQAAEQKKYYLQQIAAFNAFESELKQGYGVIKNGLSGIRDINTAELNLHSSYYNSLVQPGQQIKSSMQIQDIISWQSSIISQFTNIGKVSGLTMDEQSYINSVRANLLINCNQDMTDLQNLLAAGNLQMTDDERLKRMAKIHTAMLEKYQFTQSFCNSVRLLAAQIQQGANDTQTLKNLYGNN